LPGNNNERERAEGIYLAMVQRTIAAYREAQQAKKKPKPPKLNPQKRANRHLTPAQQKARDKKIRRDLEKNGKSESVGGGVAGEPAVPTFSFSTPLSNPNADYSSRSGVLIPCRDEVRAVMSQIGDAFGGSVDEANQIKLSTDSISYDKMQEVMTSLGFVEFTNMNVNAHTPTYGLGRGAYHWEGNVLGNWYHLNFPRTGWMSSTVSLARDAHYEPDRPDSINHRNPIGQRDQCQR
jgi:hypothetical protein